MPKTRRPKSRADWGPATAALARRGLTVTQASRELGFKSRNGAHYHAPGLFRGAHMTGAGERLESLPPREAVAEALALIRALTEPVADEPLEPWPGLSLPNMRYVRLLRYLHARAHLDDEARPAHWTQLRAAIHLDVMDWQAADEKEVRGYTRSLNKMLGFERCNLNTAVADLVPLARPWGRIHWRSCRCWLVLEPGVGAPWADRRMTEEAA